MVQNMQQPNRSYIALAVLMVGVVGCEQSRVTPAQVSPAEQRRQVLEAVAQAEREAQNTEAPAPNIELATPPGWTKAEIRPLPTVDHGFSVAYKHESGLTVTLYQFTRGLNSIPNDVTSSPIQEEMDTRRMELSKRFSLDFGRLPRKPSPRPFVWATLSNRRCGHSTINGRRHDSRIGHLRLGSRQHSI